jgi:hypothetical protein
MSYSHKGAALGVVGAMALTGGETIGVAASAGLLGAFGLPLLPVLAIGACVGWAGGQALDNATKTKALAPLKFEGSSYPAFVVGELPPSYTPKVQKPRTPWVPSQVYDTFGELV